MSTDVNTLSKILQFKSNKIKKVLLPKCKDASALETSINYNSSLKSQRRKAMHSSWWKLKGHGMNSISSWWKLHKFGIEASDLKQYKMSASHHRRHPTEQWKLASLGFKSAMGQAPSLLPFSVLSLLGHPIRRSKK